MSFEGTIHAQRMHTGDFLGGNDSDHDAFDARVKAEVEETFERMDTSLVGRNELHEAVEQSDTADVQALSQDQEMEATEALLPPAFQKRRTKKGAAESGPAFDRHFHEWREIADNLLTEDHRDGLPNDAGIWVRVQKIWHFVREQQDSWPDELVRLGGAGILVCGMRLGGKVFIGDLALLLWFVGGGSHVRIYTRYMLPIQCTRRVSCLHHAWQPGTMFKQVPGLANWGAGLAQAIGKLLQQFLQPSMLQRSPQRSQLPSWLRCDRS